MAKPKTRKPRVRRRSPRVESDFTAHFMVEVNDFGHGDERDRRRTLARVAEALYGTFGPDTVLVIDENGTRWAFDSNAHSSDVAEGGLVQVTTNQRESITP